jgi:hypothetical protein
MKTVSLYVCLIVLPLFTQGQQILNGSFEQHSANDCFLFIDNIYNPFETLSLIENTSMGAEEIWVVPGDCSYYASGGLDGGAPDSIWFINVVAISNGIKHKTTPFTLKISGSLTDGVLYKLSYYQKTPPFPQDTFNWHYTGGHQIEIGLSADSNSWGNHLIYTSPVVDTVWTLQEVVFQAPAGIKYISCRSIPTNEVTGVYLDNFSLSAISDIATVKQKVKLYPNPCRQKFKLDNKEEWDTALLSDALGRVVLQTKLKEGTNSIAVGHLKAGCYFLKLIKKGEHLSQTLLIRP